MATFAGRVISPGIEGVESVDQHGSKYLGLHKR